MRILSVGSMQQLIQSRRLVYDNDSKESRNSSAKSVTTKLLGKKFTYSCRLLIYIISHSLYFHLLLHLLWKILSNHDVSLLSTLTPTVKRNIHTFISWNRIKVV